MDVTLKDAVVYGVIQVHFLKSVFERGIQLDKNSLIDMFLNIVKICCDLVRCQHFLKDFLSEERGKYLKCFGQGNQFPIIIK